MTITFKLRVNSAVLKRELNGSKGFIHYLNEAAREFGEDAVKFMKAHPFIEGVTSSIKHTEAEKKELLKKRPEPRKLHTPEDGRGPLNTPERPWKR